MNDAKKVKVVMKDTKEWQSQGDPGLKQPQNQNQEFLRSARGVKLKRLSAGKENEIHVLRSVEKARHSPPNRERRLSTFEKNKVRESIENATYLPPLEPAPDRNQLFTRLVENERMEKATNLSSKSGRQKEVASEKVLASVPIIERRMTELEKNENAWRLEKVTHPPSVNEKRMIWEGHDYPVEILSSSEQISKIRLTSTFSNKEAYAEKRKRQLIIASKEFEKLQVSSIID
jgi:hypothetical protein